MNKIVYLAGGCFWGVESYFQKIRGVVNTEVGYLNGNSESTSYEAVCQGSGHAEVVKVEYDVNKISHEDIFILFMRVINPYSLNKQGNDQGVQYRSGIYSHDQDLLNSYQELLTNWEKANKKSAIELTGIEHYIKAEDNHQDYLIKNPNGYCHINLNNVPEEYRK